MSTARRLPLDDGKYEFVDDNYMLRCLRNGKPWRDLTGDKAVFALFDKAFEAGKPIDMILHCPECHAQHIDRPDDPDSDAARLERHRAANSVRNPVANVWTNPPHHKHLCASCGHLWKPANVNTNGVAVLP